jgi:hypothetical protein
MLRESAARHNASWILSGGMHGHPDTCERIFMAGADADAGDMPWPCRGLPGDCRAMPWLPGAMLRAETSAPLLL